jgi:DNA-binding IclR family transcriptional regulator
MAFFKTLAGDSVSCGETECTMQEGKKATDYLVGPVQKALMVLDYVATERRELTLTEIHTRLRLPKTTCFRYLKTLVASGFVAHDPTSDRYCLGDKLRLLSTKETSPLIQAALPLMRTLRDRFNETVNLAELVGSEVVYKEIVESRRSLRMQAHVGARDPATKTALGKALLATLPLDAHPPRLRVELRAAQARGWATDHGENEDDSWCVGVAITKRTALSLSAPASRMSLSLESEMGTALLVAATQIRDSINLKE